MYIKNNNLAEWFDKERPELISVTIQYDPPGTVPLYVYLDVLHNDLQYTILQDQVHVGNPTNKMYIVLPGYAELQSTPMELKTTIGDVTTTERSIWFRSYGCKIELRTTPQGT